MATVNKDFKVKNGLIVEGTTATVNNFDILTKKQADQDSIVGLIGGTSTSANTANTVVKRDANGNFAAGTVTAALTGNVTGNLTGNVTGNVTGTVSSLSNHDTADLAEGTNLYFTDERAQDAIGNNVGTGLSYNDSTGAVSVTANTYDAYGAAAAAKTAAEATAASDATSKVAAEAALRVSGDSASVATASADETSKANAAQAAAEATAAAALSAHSSDTTDIHGIANTALLATTANVATAKTEAIEAAASASTSAISAAIATEVTNRNTAIGTAVDNIVDGAPAILNTLNELAAAINDDANYTTTITTALGTKAPLASPDLTGVPTAPTAAADTNTTQIATTAFAKGEADAAEAAAASDATAKVAAEAALRVSGDSASVSTAAGDATTKANAAQAAAEATAAGDATTKANAAQAAAISTASGDATTKANAAQAAAEATAAAANTAQQNGTTSFTAINYNSVAKQVAATTGNIVTAAATTAISWVAADYRSAKLVVKAKNGVHTQVSDLVVTLDTANNVAVSEYGITYSNGTELAAVTADYSGSDVRIRVTPANNNTEVMVVGILIK